MTQLFNACEYLLDRHIAAGRRRRGWRSPAPAGELTYAAAADRVRAHRRRPARARTAARAAAADVHVRLAASSSSLYLAAMRIGAVPVPVSTMLHADGLADLLRDSRARLLAVTCQFAELGRGGARGRARASRASIAGADHASMPRCRSGCWTSSRATARRRLPEHGRTRPRSGSTPRAPPARPRRRCTGTARSRSSARPTGTQVLGIRPDDRCLSAAKAFFAYGLGNSRALPALGRCAPRVLDRPRPART